MEKIGLQFKFSWNCSYITYTKSDSKDNDMTIKFRTTVHIGYLSFEFQPIIDSWNSWIQFNCFLSLFNWIRSRKYISFDYGFSHCISIRKEKNSCSHRKVSSFFLCFVFIIFQTTVKKPIICIKLYSIFFQFFF